LNKLVERLTPKEKKEINDAITRLGYEERVRTTEEAARAIEALAAGWKGRGFFERAVARVEAWGSKLGLKLTRRAAEYIAARNLSDINAGFKAAYEQSINRVEGEEARYSYAGPQAEMPQFMRDSLSVAQAMAAKGEDAETIRSVTGWIVNPYDGKLRWEIPDNDAKFVSSSVFANAANAIFGGETAEQLVGKLGDILDHKQLFDAYPDLKNIDVLMADLRGTRAEYRPVSKTFSLPEQITVSYRSDPQKVKSSILHEIQHAIQAREGFARGTSPETAKNTRDTQIASEMALGIKSWMRDPASKNLSIDEIQRTTSDPTKKDLWPMARQLVSRPDRELKKLASKRVIGREGYRRVAGEIEARDVQARMAMTPEQRKATAPYSSEKH
jgi:hypothetical protein